jgi:hypothetical protein
MLIYFTAFWYNLWPFGKMYGRLMQFVVLWYIFPVFWYVWAKKSLATLFHTPNGGKNWHQAFDPLFASLRRTRPC